MKKYLFIDQIMCKIDDSEITENEMHDLMDAILDIIENKGFITGGGFGLKTEEELEKYFKENDNE